MNAKDILALGLGKAAEIVAPKPVAEIDPSEDSLILRDGGETQDPRLDRIVQFDENSRNYPIRELLVGDALTLPRSRTWGCRKWNDQGREGACVGFSWSHELAAQPLEILANETTAMRIYKRAQFMDPWPGEAYSGTSVLAGAKAVQELKSQGKQIMPEYRWAFGIEDAILTIGNFGPAVIGVNWYQGMFRPDANGFIHVTGPLMGGHAILVRGVVLRWKEGALTRTLADIDYDKSFFVLRNSWGKDWGRSGDCYVTIAAMHRLLNENGEMCIPVKRRA